MNRLRWATGVLAGMLIIWPHPAEVIAAEDPETTENSGNPTPPPTLAQLATAADVIAVVQMRDGDYRYQRDFPVSGSAYLKVLIPYKSDQPMDLIEVYETGLHENECYFPNPTVFEEGRRYLVFLRRDPDDAERYRGLANGCALDVLVTADNSYALRVPVTGITLGDPLQELARPMKFADRYAFETDETVDSQSRDRWIEAGLMRREKSGEDEILVYTHGISLGDVRSLLGPDVLTLERHPR